MSPHFHGESMEFECSECRFAFLIDVQPIPQSRQVVCPNCGQREIPWSMGHIVQSDNCVVRDLPPQIPRHLVVAIAAESTGEHSIIKRIVGLPGEWVVFQRGDLFVNGQLYQKSWEEIDALKVLMFDSDFLPQSTGKVSTRILTDQESLVWRRQSPGWQFQQQQQNTIANFWRYHHWRCCESSAEREQLFPIEDMYAANQTLSRDFFSMDDTIFDFELELGYDASLEFVTQYRGQDVRWSVDGKQKKIVVLAAGKSMELGRLPTAMTTSLRLELAAIDQRLLLRINGQQGLAVQIEPATGDQLSVPPCTVEIRALHGTGNLKRLRIWRDLYLFGSPDVTIENRFQVDHQGWTVPSDHYFVVGDNLPNSEDSRHWDNPFVGRTRILGKVELAAPRE